MSTRINADAMPLRHIISPGPQGNVFSSMPPSQLYPISTHSFTNNNYAERTADDISRYEDICGKFIKFDAERDFLHTWETIVDSWTALLRITSLPENKPIRRAEVVAAVNALESVINRRPGVSLPARFGYFQLANFLDALEYKIRSERDTWPNAVDRRRGTYMTVAYDMYLDALGLDPKAKPPRRELLRKRSIGRRWRAYAEPSTLLLAVYSDFAETSIKRNSLAEFPPEELSSAVLRNIPVDLLNTCRYITARTEREDRSGWPWDVSIVQDLRRHVQSNLL